VAVQWSQLAAICRRIIYVHTNADAPDLGWRLGDTTLFEAPKIVDAAGKAAFSNRP
jgi:hypothetical protein